MVGVPGKSKACANCRKRRTKCDLRQPACGQCQRARVTCGGYGRQMIFVHSTTREVDDGTLSFQGPTYTGSGSHQATPTASRQQQKSRVSRSNQSPSLLRDDLARSAYEENVIGDFWPSYLPNGRSASDAVIQFSNYGWTNVAHELYRKGNPNIRIALLANAMGLIGQREDAPLMLRKSQQLYGSALLTAEEFLRNPNKQEVHEVMTALKLLSFHEMWFGSDSNKTPAQFKRWATHVNGTTAYVLSSGPQAYKRGYTHRLFLDIRLAQAISGIQFRQPSPFAEPEWKTIPWEETNKDPKDTLIDIILEFPGITAEIDAIEACQDEAGRVTRRKLLSLKCWSLGLDLQTWAANCGRPALDLAESKIKNGTAEYSSVTTSEEFAMGHAVLQYWASCIILYRTTRLVSINPEAIAKEIPQNSDPLVCCRKMAHFIPFFLGPNAGCHFVNMALFPIATALRHITRMGESGLLEEKMLLLKAFKGFVGKVASGLVRSYQSYEGPKHKPFLD